MEIGNDYFPLGNFSHLKPTVADTQQYLNPGLGKYLQSSTMKLKPRISSSNSKVTIEDKIKIIEPPKSAKTASETNSHQHNS